MRCPAAGPPLFQAAAANFSFHSQAQADTSHQGRGLLLLISGVQDHTVPDVVTQSTLRQYRHSTVVTELKQFEHLGHSLMLTMAGSTSPMRSWNGCKPTAGSWPEFSRPSTAMATGVLVAAASIVSFAESYCGLYLWASHHGLHGVWAVAWPLQVDVFIAVGELALFVALADRWPPRIVAREASGTGGT
jgi:hypothetical protein